MKVIRYIIGALALIGFFLVIDPTGVGFKNHLNEIRKWARGESRHLRFKAAGK